MPGITSASRGADPPAAPAAVLGRRARQPRLDLPRLRRAHHRPGGETLAVVGDPVDQRMTELAKLLRIHGPEHTTQRPPRWRPSTDVRRRRWSPDPHTP